MLDFPCEVGLDGQQVFWARLAKVKFVQVEDALQFVNGRGVVVHAQVNQPVVVAAVAALGLHDEQPGCLLTAPVAAGCLPRLQRGDQPVSQFALHRLERTRHGLDHRCAGEDIALAAVAVAYDVPCPRHAVLACEGGSSALRVHDARLTAVALVIGFDQLLQDFVGRDALRQQLQAAWAVGRVGMSLRCKRADAGLRKRHDRAGGQEF